METVCQVGAGFHKISKMAKIGNMVAPPEKGGSETHENKSPNRFPPNRPLRKEHCLPTNGIE